jgi:glutaryl-CoA dehydrogenase
MTDFWQDPLKLEAQLSDEENLIQKTARDFCQKQLLPGIVEANRHEKFDAGIMRQLGELGLLGSTIDGYGCAGTSHVA